MQAYSPFAERRLQLADTGVFLVCERRRIVYLYPSLFGLTKMASPTGLQALVAQKTLHGVLVRGHAGLAINNLRILVYLVTYDSG